MTANAAGLWTFAAGGAFRGARAHHALGNFWTLPAPKPDKRPTFNTVISAPELHLHIASIGEQQGEWDTYKKGHNKPTRLAYFGPNRTRLFRRIDLQRARTPPRISITLQTRRSAAKRKDAPYHTRFYSPQTQSRVTSSDFLCPRPIRFDCGGFPERCA